MTGDRAPGNATGFITFPCPRCMADTKVLGSMAGRSMKCPKCTKNVQVPGERKKREAGFEVVKDDEEPERVEREREVERRERATYTVPPALPAFGLVLGAGALLGLGHGLITLLSGAGFGIPGVIMVALSGYLGKLALDLREGKRTAVVGLTIVLFLTLPLDLLVLKVTRASAAVGLAVVGLRLFLLGVPALIGFINWRRLQ